MHLKKKLIKVYVGMKYYPNVVTLWRTLGHIRKNMFKQIATNKMINFNSVAISASRGTITIVITIVVSLDIKSPIIDTIESNIACVRKFMEAGVVDRTFSTTLCCVTVVSLLIVMELNMNKL